jgi:hypothetical protein
MRALEQILDVGNLNEANETNETVSKPGDAGTFPDQFLHGLQ